MKQYVIYDKPSGNIVKVGFTSGDPRDQITDPRLGQSILEFESGNYQDVNDDNYYVVNKTLALKPDNLLAPVYKPKGFFYPDNFSYQEIGYWSDGELGYSDDFTSYANEDFSAGRWIEYTFDTPVWMTTFYIWIKYFDSLEESLPDCKIELYFNGSYSTLWNNQIQQDYLDEGGWFYYPVASTPKLISKVRITGNQTNGAGRGLRIYGLGAKRIIGEFQNVPTGATQEDAGAAQGQLWATSGHATLPDNVVMLGTAPQPSSSSSSTSSSSSSKSSSSSSTSSSSSESSSSSSG